MRVSSSCAAGSGGDLRVLYVLPRGAASFQHVKVLKRLSEGNGNFPTVLDYAARRGRLYIILAWVWGPDLRSHLCRIRTRPRLWPTAVQAFTLFRRLAHGVSLLHRHTNCVHGDLKPENLILARHPNRLVLIDFGSAWTTERTTSRVEGDGHSDAYTSPEQHRGTAFLDWRGDQFSASIVGYELLTGELPYGGLGGKAARPEYGSAFTDSLAPPSARSRDQERLPRHVLREIDRVILKGLALNPDDRYASHSAWLSDLDAIDAELKLRPRLGRLSRATLSVLDWLGALFRR